MLREVRGLLRHFYSHPTLLNTIQTPILWNGPTGTVKKLVQFYTLHYTVVNFRHIMERDTVQTLIFTI